MVVITVDHLKKAGVCEEACKRFSEIFGYETIVTEDVAESVAYIFDWNDAAIHLLEEPFLHYYEEVAYMDPCMNREWMAAQDRLSEAEKRLEDAEIDLMIHGIEAPDDECQLYKDAVEAARRDLEIAQEEEDALDKVIHHEYVRKIARAWARFYTEQEEQRHARKNNTVETS